MQIDEIKKIANLARIDITDIEAESYAKSLDSVITLISSINDLEVNDNEFKQEGFAPIQKTREDKEVIDKPKDIHKTLINSSKNASDNYIKVKKII